jgi:esterase/lipase superfamily enzyme
LSDDRLKLRDIATLDGSVFWTRLSASITELKPGDRSAIIFVHGYNVSFRGAALQAAQIGYDLTFRGPMAFFSWPSKAKITGYMADEATIEPSQPFLVNFIVDFVARSGATSIHILAHSMGNRLVLAALKDIADRLDHRRKHFGQIMLAAADVDADRFRQLANVYVKLGRRTTLYVSQKDIAVGAARWLHEFPRVGLLPPVFVEPGLDTVNVTNVDLTMLGHGYVSEARDVLNDMHALITHGAPPSARFGLEEAKTDNNEDYWVIRGGR